MGAEMVEGEPNDVRVKHAYGQWMVRIAEDGVVTRQLFESKRLAEGFAEVERIRLGLPGEPPVDDQS
jgi:hypothetical protein